MKISFRGTRRRGGERLIVWGDERLVGISMAYRNLDQPVGGVMLLGRPQS